ncbi:MAG: type I-F CRISPR-associated helicase Cas3f, partial [Oceanococcaceae bacterium]
AWLGKKAGSFNQAWLEQPLSQVTHAWNEIKQAVAARDFEPYWALAAALPVELPAWQKQAARVAKGLLALHQRRPSKWLDNAYVMHLARLSLMLADHHYSSLGVGDDGRPAEGRKPYLQAGQELFANTWKDRRGRSHGKQSLSEHLLGVAGEAGLIAHALPGFERHLPRLANHRGLRKRSADPRFQWQDKAYDAAAALREVARDHGAFVVNMASTGCGKTLANARILYALADPQRGLRASYALGLRTLTLQTGQSYRRDLHLGEDELAVLVGGAASRALYAYYEQRAEGDGSASVQSLLEEDSHVLYEGNEATHPLLVRALADPSIRRLLSAPMLTCTVDHLVPATESLRGGRQIAPMLRLMSADLVLDELDDYDLKDLPTLARLLHWAGMLGTRVVLSSATLPPALVEGMFRAYQAGRRVFRRNRGTDCAAAGEHIEVPCLWADEFGVQTKRCADVAALSEAHAEFVQRRVDSLGKRPPQRLVKLWPLQIKQGRREQLRAALAAQVREACLHMHTEHAEVEPITGQRVSFGIVRMANIDPIIDVARELYRMGAPEGVHIHLCVYHARFPLAQRSHIEHLLDEVLDRREQGGVWSRSAVRAAIDAAPQCEHLFLVLASPVCEVGRDWDADWAVAEPSSMRSLIQLAGRVKRHRPGVPTTPNVVVFDTNLRALEQRQPAYSRPGYESAERFALRSHRLGVLWPDADGQRLDATPRIWPRPLAERQPANNWIDLEHARLEAAMQPLPEPAAGPLSASAAGERSRPGAVSLLRLERDHCTPSWHFPQAALLGVLPQEQPFREDNRPDSTLVWLPDEDEEDLSLHRIEHALEKAGKSPYVEATESLLSLEQGMGVVPWGAMGRPELLKHLRELAEVEGFGLREAACKFATVDVPTNPNTLAWRWHPWLGYTEQR